MQLTSGRDAMGNVKNSPLHWRPSKNTDGSRYGFLLYTSLFSFHEDHIIAAMIVRDYDDHLPNVPILRLASKTH